MNLPDLRFPARLSGPLAIEHVTVLPMTGPAELPDRTVVIDAGRIVTVARSAEFDATGLTRIDGTGRWLMPGLADMHVHLWHPGDAALYLAHGVTTVRNLSGAPFHLALARRCKRGERPGPRLITTGPIIEGARPVLPGWLIAPDAAAGVAAAEWTVARGYAQVKVYNGVPLPALRAIGETAARLGVPVVGHCPTEATYEQAIEAGMRCFEHFVGIWRGHLRPGVPEQGRRSNIDLAVLLASADGLDFDALRRLAEHMARHEVWNCPTLVAARHMYRRQPAALADPVFQPWLDTVPALALAIWDRLDPVHSLARFGAASYEAWFAAMQARDQAFARLVGLLHGEGAPLLIGTDAPVRFVFPGLSAHQEIGLFADAGLSIDQALRCATVEAARFLGESADWGTVEPGRRADLVLLRANPRADLAALSQVEGVSSNGCWLDRGALGGLIEQARDLASTALPAALAELAAEADTFGPPSPNRLDEWTDGLRSGQVLAHREGLPADGWRLDEAAVFERGDIFSPGGAQHRRVSLHLAPDFTLAAATWTHATYAGEAAGSLCRTEAGDYVLRLHAADGFTTEQPIPGDEPLYPDDRLTETALPWLLSRLAGEPRELRALSIDAEVAAARGLSLLPQPSAVDAPPTWQVTAEHADAVAVSTYELAPAGTLATRRSARRVLRAADPAPPINER